MSLAQYSAAFRIGSDSHSALAAILTQIVQHNFTQAEFRSPIDCCQCGLLPDRRLFAQNRRPHHGGG